ncbi:MAG: glycine betaine ABC transporter substrate-binding protein, partial [Solirubrobacterales bacterium]
MSPIGKLKHLLLVGAFALSLGLAACSSDDSSESSSNETAAGGELIQSNPDNSGTSLTIGSKNFTEQIVLGEIYAQALKAAGYDVKTDLNLGSETIALQALKEDEISGYPEYVSTALTSFYGKEAEEVPTDSQDAFDAVSTEVEADGLVALPPTPFSSANAVGLLTSKADELGVKTISDLEGKSQDLALYGSPECRQRIDCLVGLEQNYGLEFSSFTPVDIGLRYGVLDKGQADLSIVFTTDAQLGATDEYTIL